MTKEKSPFFAPTAKKNLIKTTPGGTKRIINEDAEDKSSILGTIGNLMNSIVGCGIVGIAFAIKESGLIAGVFLILLVAGMTEKSVRLLIETAKHIHVPSYEMLCEATFGMMGFYFVCCSMFVMSYGAMIAYLLVVKDTLPYLLGVDVNDDIMKRCVLILSSFCIIFPLSCQRDMASLAKTSSMNVVFDTILVILVCYFAPVGEGIKIGIGIILTRSTLRPKTVFVGIGVLAFAFSCHHATFLICGSLNNPTRQRWATVTRVSLSLCALLATCIGIIGYLAFGETTQGDILNNFIYVTNENSIFAGNVARALLCSTMFFVYPIDAYVARHVLVVVLFSGRQAHEGDDHAVLARWDRRILLTFFLYMCALIPALIFQDLGNVVALAGALGGSCLGYIGPGCTFLAVHGEEFLSIINAKFYNRHNCTYTKISYHILLIPFWCRIASFGQETLQDFLKEEAMKSPHLNRLGEVKHKPTSAVVVQLIHIHEENNDKIPLLPRSSSYDTPPQLSKLYGSTSALDSVNTDIRSPTVLTSSVTNRDIAAAIAKKMIEDSNHSLEEDPQDECPHWSDFVISIFFIIFGFIAIAAGFLSIFMSGESG